MGGLPTGQKWFRRTVIVFGGTLLALVLVSLQGRGIPEALETDWTSFDTAASRFFAGEEVYQPWHADLEPLPYLYPPFALWIALPLASVGFVGSWVLSATLALSSFLGGMLFLVKVAKRGSGDLFDEKGARTGLIAAALTGTVINGVIIGQYSGLYVLSVGLGLWLLSLERKVLAGLAFALLLLKPNIGVPMLIIVLWARQWRVAAGFGLGSLLALAASIPFGLDQWARFVSNVQNMADLQSAGFVPARKMVTFLGAVEETFGLAGDSRIAIGLWLVFTLATGLATLTVFTPKEFAISPQRAFAIWSIFVVVANPRMFFYDGALVVFGVVALWTLPEGVLGERSRRLLPAFAAAMWFASWGAAFLVLNALVAPLSFALVALVAIEVVGRRAKPELFEDLPDGKSESVDSPAPVVPPAAAA